MANTMLMIKIDRRWYTFRQAVLHFGVVSYQLAHHRVRCLGWTPLAAAATPKEKPGKKTKETA